jgi:hypothetical protein
MEDDRSSHRSFALPRPLIWLNKGQPNNAMQAPSLNSVPDRYDTSWTPNRRLARMQPSLGSSAYRFVVVDLKFRLTLGFGGNYEHRCYWRERN